MWNKLLNEEKKVWMKLKIDFKAFKFSIGSRESLNGEKIDSESLIFTFGFDDIDFYSYDNLTAGCFTHATFTQDVTLLCLFE